MRTTVLFMKQQEITTLKIIESLEKDPNQTQRDLAKELNISLGLVNSFTKRLIHKGYLKIKTIPKKRIKYILTPEGMCEKTRLTYQFIMHSLEYYKETRKKIRSIYEQLYRQGKKRVVFLGVCEMAEIALITLKESKLEFAGIIDKNEIGKRFLGEVVSGRNRLQMLMPEDVLLIMKHNAIEEQIDFMTTVSTEFSVIRFDSHYIIENMKSEINLKN